MNSFLPGTYLHSDDGSLEELISIDRLARILVRCACCRFTCAAQDAPRLLGYVESDPIDYVRDVQVIERCT